MASKIRALFLASGRRESQRLVVPSVGGSGPWPTAARNWGPVCLQLFPSVSQSARTHWQARGADLDLEPCHEHCGGSTQPPWGANSHVELVCFLPRAWLNTCWLDCLTDSLHPPWRLTVGRELWRPQTTASRVSFPQTWLLPSQQRVWGVRKGAQGGVWCPRHRAALRVPGAGDPQEQT